MLCDASGDLDWISLLLAPIGGVVAAGFSYEWFPLLPEPDPNERPTDHDRKMLRWATAVSVVIGLCCGAVLLLTLTPAPEEMRFVSDGAIKAGPLLLAFGTLIFVWPAVAKRMVRPGPLIHLLSKPKRLGRTMDERRAACALSVLLIVLAVWLHLGFAGVHTTFDQQGVRWRSWPWHSEQMRPWSDLTELQLLVSYDNCIGVTVKRPHLALTFEPSLQLLIGISERRSKGWEEPAAFASARSGVAVQKVGK